MKIAVNVNGADFESEVEPRRLLVHYLREDLSLTGTHIGCVVGICGACTILFEGRTIKSCLMLAVQASGKRIITIEGLADEGNLHPIQKAFMESFAIQCGYCTPGMILATYGLLKDNPDPSEETIKKNLSGNLCMCTGYQAIIEAVRKSSAELRKRKSI